MKARVRKKELRAEEQALRLIESPLFLHKAVQKIGQLGVVGEKRNLTILTLAGITRTMPEPASVLYKGATSTGKTKSVRSTIELFPPDSIVERAGLSGKALAHGEGSLAEKILYLVEYRCGKDAQQLLRLLQSEGRIKHEFTTLSGSRRETRTAERVGTPVVLTTTTDRQVFPDDETRFLSIWADESAEQSLAIVLARATGARFIDRSDLPMWQLATSLLVWKDGDFANPPDWLQYVASNLPLGKVRIRRDWDRFLTFCSAIAMCRGDWSPNREVNVEFADYCVAYEILEPVFASTLRGLRTQEYALGRAVASLNGRLKRAVSVKEVAGVLQWKEGLVYKYLKGASERGLLKYEGGTRERNEKRILANDDPNGFLPPPGRVFRENPQIGKGARFVDPFSGEWRSLLRSRSGIRFVPTTPGKPAIAALAE